MFDGDELFDATPRAYQMINADTRDISSWEKLIGLLRPAFPLVEARIGELTEDGDFSLDAEDGASRIDAEIRRGILRLTIAELVTPDDATPLDGFALNALTDKLDILHRIVDDAPLLVWRQNAENKVSWANGSYMALCRDVGVTQEITTWPLPTVFRDLEVPKLMKTDGMHRISITVEHDKKKLWFECVSQPIENDTLYFALPADRLVTAETTLREFVQTLSKTFADLPIGLAIFDCDRLLALFNPALTDLTTLEPGFLATRPSLYTFLDTLREKQRMPEPKDYKAWRRGISDLETAAVNGTYQENWSLPTGQTYRVTGQPHPDGAVAFLFEDISAEISLTRNFRSELELLQDVVDNMEEAVAVFSPGGTLLLTNNTYADLWKSQPDATLNETSIVDATREWQDLCHPSPIWGDARDFVSGDRERAEWDGVVELNEGGHLLCRVAPLTGNTTMITFRQIADVPQGEETTLQSAVTAIR
ncbi:PAS-domain containing protein [Actibacterium sp. 188UL27-1]|uniref:PAS-domain containing protein n=1 Tax=Actibacterium sp. 188UL27-1 TaxID=2786961 RepID=UPI00195AA441|nr:PAS-domain containing protein [Actibacterium sp. 188UL27-1]MBM7067227.1 PAS-domain containing protein [Actibacterium sp. 188UL27-1]